MAAVEFAARDKTDFSAKGSISEKLALYDFESGEAIWPPPQQQQVDVSYFAPQPFDRKYSGDWWVSGEEDRQRKLEAEARALKDEEVARKEFWRPRA